MSFAQMGFILGSWQMTYIVLAIAAGVIMDRWGIRRSIFFGALVIGLSAVLRSAASGFYSLLFFVALFGVGGPMISSAVRRPSPPGFRVGNAGPRLAFIQPARGLAACTLAATNSVVMPLTDYSWRLTFVSYGVMTLVFAGFWWGLAREAGTESRTARFRILPMLADLFQIRTVRLILLSGLFSFGIMHGYFAWLPKILENGGMSPAAAGVASALPFLTSIPAVLIFPRIVPPHQRGWAIGLLALLAGFSISWVVIPATAGDLFRACCFLVFPAPASCHFWC